MVKIHIKQSQRLTPLRQGVYLCLGKTNSIVCPINSMLFYLTVRKGSPGSLFIMKNGQFLTQQLFGTQLDSTLQEAGQNTKHNNTHSFRKGAATSAHDAGISEANIQMLGRCKSNAYKSYIRTPREKLAKFHLN